MAKAIRKRCGYGCVICGKPIYEYHHINGYRKETGHIEMEITLLCDGCHRKERGGLISRDDVVRSDANPINRTNGRSAPDQVWYAQGPVRIHIGTNTIHANYFGDDGVTILLLVLDGRPVLRLREEDGIWLLSARISDAWNRPLVQIHENELVYLVEETDITFVGGVLTVGPGSHPMLRIKFRPPDLFIQEAVFVWNGILVMISEKKGLHRINKDLVISGLQTDFQVVYNFGRDPANRGGFFRLGVPTRFSPVELEGQVREIPESMFPLEDISIAERFDILDEPSS
ncbi:MAG: HNH endonuclease [Burkholderiales bacterium]|nr:HNH endonuclease [Phycisphaerae bacterium]